MREFKHSITYQGLFLEKSEFLEIFVTLWLLCLELEIRYISKSRRLTEKLTADFVQSIAELTWNLVTHC